MHACSVPGQQTRAEHERVGVLAENESRHKELNYAVNYSRPPVSGWSAKPAEHMCIPVFVFGLRRRKIYYTPPDPVIRKRQRAKRDLRDTSPHPPNIRPQPVAAVQSEQHSSSSSSRSSTALTTARHLPTQPHQVSTSQRVAMPDGQTLRAASHLYSDDFSCHRRPKREIAGAAEFHTAVVLHSSSSIPMSAPLDCLRHHPPIHPTSP